MAKTGQRRKIEIEEIYDLQHYASEAIFYVVMSLPKPLREKGFSIAINRVTNHLKWEKKHG